MEVPAEFPVDGIALKVVTALRMSAAETLKSLAELGAIHELFMTIHACAQRRRVFACNASTVIDEEPIRVIFECFAASRTEPRAGCFGLIRCAGYSVIGAAPLFIGIRGPTLIYIGAISWFVAIDAGWYIQFGVAGFSWRSAEEVPRCVTFKSKSGTICPICPIMVPIIVLYAESVFATELNTWVSPCFCNAEALSHCIATVCLVFKTIHTFENGSIVDAIQNAAIRRIDMRVDARGTEIPKHRCATFNEDRRFHHRISVSWAGRIRRLEASKIRRRGRWHRFGHLEANPIFIRMRQLGAVAIINGTVPSRWTRWRAAPLPDYSHGEHDEPKSRQPFSQDERHARQITRQTPKIHSIFADRRSHPLVCKDRDR